MSQSLRRARLVSLHRHRVLYGLDGAALYFSYGANLNRAHMRQRCPTAEPVGRANLVGFRLVLRRYADVEPDRAGLVPGVVWRIRRADEAALDQYEGFPIVYGKEHHTVTLLHGEQACVMLYRMVHGATAPPPVGYLESVRQGYADFGIPAGTLDAAVDRAWRPLLRRFAHLPRHTG